MFAKYKHYEFTLPKLGENEYGREWPKPHGKDIGQITRELVGFREDGSGGMLSRYEHGLNLIRLLWPGHVKLFRKWKHWKTGEEVIIWNHFFLRAFKALCSGKRTAFTGCSSSGKTFVVAVYCVLMFMCNPESTTVMVSTTAGTDAERRVWGEIKELHKLCEKTYPIGKLIDYLKVITFDPGRELEGARDVSARDIRNGIILIPVPQGSEGDKALGKIIGTKNGMVIWVIDEMPHMIDHVTRPESNLESNRFQLIGLGNANKKTDPHGTMCEPVDGYSSISVNDDEWMGVADTNVLFFHGERSPNFHPAVDPKIKNRDEYPFPYLSSPVYVNRVAELNGRGNPESGRKTIDFVRFAIGFWYGDDIANTVLSPLLVKEHNADNDDVDWGFRKLTVVAGGDFAYTAGGDKNKITFATFGEDHLGRQRLLCDKESFTITPNATDAESYWTDVADQAVKELNRRGVKPNNFGMDTNGDGGKMLQAIQKRWKTHECVALSSLEATEDKSTYDNIVTQYWWQTAEAVMTGCVRGFNILSGYAKDLFARQYESVGKGRVKVEKKDEMKKRIKRSPDDGDSFSYMIEMAKRAGFNLKTEVSEATLEHRERVNKLFSGQLTDDSEDEDYASFEESIGEEVGYYS